LIFPSLFPPFDSILYKSITIFTRNNINNNNNDNDNNNNNNNNNNNDDDDDYNNSKCIATALYSGIGGVCGIPLVCWYTPELRPFHSRCPIVRGPRSGSRGPAATSPNPIVVLHVRNPCTLRQSSDRPWSAGHSCDIVSFWTLNTVLLAFGFLRATTSGADNTCVTVVILVTVTARLLQQPEPGSPFGVRAQSVRIFFPRSSFVSLLFVCLFSFFFFFISKTFSVSFLFQR
jgi:hypothetical protein